MRSYFYSLLHRLLSTLVTDEDSVVEIDPITTDLIKRFRHGSVAFRGARRAPAGEIACHVGLDAVRAAGPDYILLGGSPHYERDVQTLLEETRSCCAPETRLLVVYYSALWRPLLRLASWLGVREKQPEANWLAHEDVANLLLLSGFELVHVRSAILVPVWIPLLGAFANRVLAHLPGLRALNLVNLAVARPVPAPLEPAQPSVSIVVPARNEAGNIEQVVARVPRMGPDDELIFVEGHSSDGTWDVIRRVAAEHGGTRRIVIAQQEGKGKGDAVRKGFALARNEIFMILDADLTVPPEDLPRFYRTIVSGAGEFINGSRLVYPMEERAMRFLNMIGNRFFAWAFSYVLGQRFKDTLCGTKVLSKANYERIQRHRSFFGDFDPFGDFDLIFGAARLCLKIVEVPVRYRERRYGETNISRWTHGALLFRMLGFAARKLKFV